MTIKSYLAEQLKRFRNAKKMTTVEVGNYLGRRPQSVSAWENEKALPDVEMLVHLAELYDVDIADFFERGHRDRSLSYNERELVDIYRALDGDGRLLLTKITRDVGEVHFQG